MSIHEIRVTSLGADPVAEDVQAEIQRTLGFSGIEQVKTTKVYRLEDVTDDEADRVAKEVLTDPVHEQATVNQPPSFDTPHVVEVAYKPGVMNPEAGSIIKAANDLGIRPAAADSSREYAFFGRVRPEQVQAVVGRLLVNEIVEHVVAEKPQSLLIQDTAGPITTLPIRGASLKVLQELSRDKLFLDDDDMRFIQSYSRELGRDLTDAELEIIAAWNSDHCRHTTFNARVMVDGQEKEPLFKRIKNAAREHFGDLVVSAFDDNSGVIRAYDGHALCAKVETHNKPSSVEPFGGANTCTGGVLRDVMGTGQGAKNLLTTNMFCLADPNLLDAKLPPGTLRPDYTLRKVVAGVRDYGNPMGIPNANGSLHFHEDFRANPSVIGGAYGILPEAQAQKGQPELGDLVVIIGGRTGRDGIHGATFSSGESTDRTASVNSSAVQIGNPIEEKRMFDAILEARDTDCIQAITDCGAAGFSSAIGEMGEDIGVTVDISKAPLKYPGLAPWEIWLSESQERMVVAIDPANIETFMDICAKYNTEATILGEFDGSHTLTVNYGEQNVAELDYEFLKSGLPQRVMEARWEKPEIEEITPTSPETEQEWIDRLKAVVAHGNVCSKEPIVRQYDHGVQGGNIVPPFGGPTQEGPNDAVVIKPLLDRPWGVVQSHGMNPILNRLHPYRGTVWAIAEALSNYVAVGGNHQEAALVGNYIAAYPDEDTMGALDMMTDAAVDMMHLTGVPVISGKDSLSSTYRGNGEVIKIPPVYCASVFGRIPDVERTVTADIKKPGKSELFLVGTPSRHMGGSTYYDIAGGQSAEVPEVDTENLPAVLRKVHEAIADGEILACHDVSEGGLAAAVTEMCIGGNCGARLYVRNDGYEEAFLFSETAGCFVVELDNQVNAFDLFGDLPWQHIGRTTNSQDLEAKTYRQQGSEWLFQAPIKELKKAWQAPMREVFHS